MNIAFFETDSYEQEFFTKKCAKHNTSFYPHALTTHDLKHLYQTEILVTFIYSKITKEIIHNMPCLKLIVTMSTGYDHIDLDACRRAGITVCNIPRYGGECVAEHTFALILALLRNVHRGIERTRHDDFSIEGLRGLTLEGKTLGVIGAGAIGSRVIELARAFHMKVLVYTDTKKKGTHDHITYTTLSDLLTKSDIVTLHVPHTPKTHHMINTKTLAMMKRGAFLINTARGPLVDTQALSHALETKRLAGAALDVLEGEAQLHEIHQPMKHTHHSLHDWRMLRKAHTLLKHKNVIVTPHIAFYTKESVDTILKTTLENIEAFLSGKHLNVITFN